jgi:hypothetical protein
VNGLVLVAKVARVISLETTALVLDGADRCPKGMVVRTPPSGNCCRLASHRYECFLELGFFWEVDLVSIIDDRNDQCMKSRAVHSADAENEGAYYLSVCII